MNESQNQRALTPDELLDQPVTHAEWVLRKASESPRQATQGKARRIDRELRQLAHRLRGEAEVAEAEERLRAAREKLSAPVPTDDTEEGTGDAAVG